MKISFCELLMFGTFGFMLLAVSIGLHLTVGIPMLHKLKQSREGRAGMFAGITVACCLAIMFIVQAWPQNGIQIVSCTAKQEGADAVALASNSLPCPCGCGKHISN